MSIVADNPYSKPAYLKGPLTDDRAPSGLSSVSDNARLRSGEYDFTLDIHLGALLSPEGTYLIWNYICNCMTTWGHLFCYAGF